MHISEGVLSPEVLLGTWALTVGGVALGLRRTRYEELPRVAVVSSALFVASLVHVPLGPVSAHLVLNGLAGLLLGWAVFPAVFISLALQAVLFQHGGLTSLGANTLSMAAPAVLLWALLGPLLGRGPRGAALGGFLAGAVGLFLASVLMALMLYLTGEAFLNIARLAVLAYLPLAVLEGLVTAFSVAFLRRTRPEVLLLTLALLLSSGSPSHGHGLGVFAYQEGQQLHVEGYFSAGEPCKGCQVRVLKKSTGALLYQGRTDQQGRLSLPLSQTGRIQVVLSSDPGHRAVYELELSRPREGQALLERLQAVEGRLGRIEQLLQRRRLLDALAALGFIVGAVGLWAWLRARKGG